MAQSRPLSAPRDLASPSGGRHSRIGSGHAAAPRLSVATDRALDTQEWRSQPWEEPHPAKAEENRRALLALEGSAPICTMSTSVLDDMGPGIALHFQFLKALMIYFLVATVIAIPILMFFAAGSRLSTDELDPVRLAKLSIGNAMAPSRNFTTTIAGREYTGRQISGIITACDFLYTVGFLILIAALWGKIRSVVQQVEERAVSARDYAVFVRGLPKDVTEDEVRDHFNMLYNAQAPDWTNPSSWRHCWCTRKMRQRPSFPSAGDESVPIVAVGTDSKALPPVPASTTASAGQPGEATKVVAVRDLVAADVAPVTDTTNSGDDGYEGGWVAEVSLARANGNLIKRYQALTGFFLRIRQARAAVRKFSEDSRYADSAKKAAALRRLEAIEKELTVINQRYSKKYQSDVVAAFVTFNHELSAARCCEDYQGSDAWYHPNSFWQPSSLRFRGVHRLSVRRAPDPSQVMWQNLEITLAQRRARQFGVGLLMVVLLIVSFVFIMAAQTYQMSFRSRVPNLSMCRTALPAIAFNRSMTPTGNLADPSHPLPSDLVYTRESGDPTCGAVGKSRLRWLSASNASQPLTSPLAADACFDECIESSPPSTAVCSYPSSQAGVQITIPRETYVACYCYDRLLTNINTYGLWEGSLATRRADGNFCFSVALDFASYNALIVVAALVVVIINLSMSFAVPAITALEGHIAVDSMHRSTALYAFLAMFGNTAILALIINAAMPAGVASVNVAGRQVFRGSYASFDPRWHAAVGAGIVLTLLVNVFTPHVMPFLTGCCFLPCARCTMRYGGGAVTQTELNQQLAPPEFLFPVRTAVVLNTLFSTLFYSSGHPILLPIGAASFAICFWVDKLALLRIYRRPPRYDDSMARFTVSTLPWAIVLHIGIAIWMISDPLVLYSPSIFDRSQPGIVSSSVNAVLEGVFGGYKLEGSTQVQLGLDIADRLSRENTLPMFVLLCVVVLAWFLYSTAGKALVGLVSRMLCCGRDTLPCAREKAPLLHNPPFTGPFAFPLDNKTAHVIAPFEVPAGWRMGRDALGQLLRLRVWPFTGVTFGLEHAKDERMLTWQVIAHNGIASYDIAANPLYAPAVRAIDAARERWEVQQAGASARTRDKASTHRMASAVVATGGQGGGTSGASTRTMARLADVVRASQRAIRHRRGSDPAAPPLGPDDNFHYKNPLRDGPPASHPSPAAVVITVPDAEQAAEEVPGMPVFQADIGAALGFDDVLAAAAAGELEDLDAVEQTLQNYMLTSPPAVITHDNVPSSTRTVNALRIQVGSAPSKSSVHPSMSPSHGGEVETEQGDLGDQAIGAREVPLQPPHGTLPIVENTVAQPPHVPGGVVSQPPASGPAYVQDIPTDRLDGVATGVAAPAFPVNPSPGRQHPAGGDTALE